MTLETRPDGGTIQHAYHGLSVTDTNQLAQTQTTLKNSRGEIVSVTDNLSHTTSFVYDPFGNLKTTTDPASNVIGNTYDKYGRKIAMSDPDMGTWSYGHDVLGQLTSQTNARGQTVTLAYDTLGRLTGRSEPDLTSTWVYDTQTKGVGKLANTSTTAGFQRSITYDTISRPIQSSVTVDGSTYNTTSTYDSAGRIGAVSYPSGFGVTYTYNTIGYLTAIRDGASSLAYWTANAYDAESHLTQATFGNNIVANKVYSPDTGRIATIQAGTGNTVQNLSFTFNTLGNLTQRVDAVTQTTDDMSYDGLNRLTQAVTSNPSLPLNVTKTVTYNAIGNITIKSDVGTYSYDPMRVHAVAGIVPGATGTVTASYSYDANGNMLTGRGRNVSWTSFDMVDAITQGTNAVAFTYDSEHARLKQVSSDGSTKYYLNDPTSGAMAEKIVGASLSVTWNDYVMLGGEMVALKVSGAASQTRYFHKDHLGSIVALTDESATVVERNSFDAWGQRRSPMGEDDPLYPGQSITSQITRGYTGHEQLDSVGLVHMNGRIYEPVIGKMMSADPTVPNPIDGQAYNRYTYVLNNPISLTDPSGFYAEAPFEAASIAIGAKSFYDNIVEGNYLDAVVDAAGVVADVALALAPVAPGVVGLGIQSTRKGINLADDIAEQAATTADNAAAGAAQAAKQVDAGIGAGAVKSYDVDSFGNLQSRSVPGDGLDIDHIPSHASNIARMEAELGAKLSPSEVRALRNEGTAVAVPNDLHRSSSPTYGGRNTPEQIEGDRLNPKGAVDRDTNAMAGAARAENRAAAERARDKVREMQGGHFP